MKFISWAFSSKAPGWVGLFAFIITVFVAVSWFIFLVIKPLVTLGLTILALIFLGIKAWNIYAKEYKDD